MFIYEQKCSTMSIENCRNPVLKQYMVDEGLSEIKINYHIDMKCADGSIVIGWLASQTDMLSDDWVIVGEYDHCVDKVTCNCGEDCCNKPEEPEIEESENEEPDGE